MNSYKNSFRSVPTFHFFIRVTGKPPHVRQSPFLCCQTPEKTCRSESKADCISPLEQSTGLMLWNRVSQPDGVHVTCFCLYYSQRIPAFPLGLFFPSTSFCFCSSCSSCVFVCVFFVCTRCLLSLTDDERKDAVSLQSWPLICLPPLLLNQSLQRHTNWCHGFSLLLSFFF